MRDSFRIGREVRPAVGERFHRRAQARQQGGDRRPEVDPPHVADEGRDAHGPSLDVEGDVGTDFDLGVGAFEQRNEALLHRQHHLARPPHRLDRFGQDVGEEHFVAQALLADQKQGLALQRVARREARAVDMEQGGVAIVVRQARLIGWPALDELAAGDQHGRAG